MTHEAADCRTCNETDCPKHPGQKAKCPTCGKRNGDHLPHGYCTACALYLAKDRMKRRMNERQREFVDLLLWMYDKHSYLNEKGVPRITEYETADLILDAAGTFGLAYVSDYATLTAVLQLALMCMAYYDVGLAHKLERSIID